MAMSVTIANITKIIEQHIKGQTIKYMYLLYKYRDLHSKKDRDKNSLFALEKPADWSYDFFH